MMTYMCKSCDEIAVEMNSLVKSQNDRVIRPTHVNNTHDPTSRVKALKDGG